MHLCPGRALCRCPPRRVALCRTAGFFHDGAELPPGGAVVLSRPFGGATDASISQRRFFRLALGRTAVNGFSTKKAILRLRRPFAATDGLQNRHFKQASDGRHGKARSFFVCGDAAAAPEDGASDHGLALFVFRGAFCIQRNIPSAPRRNDKVYRSGDKPENAGEIFYCTVLRDGFAWLALPRSAAFFVFARHPLILQIYTYFITHISVSFLCTL